MPHWLRMTTFALYAGACTGCGTNGLFWVDSKLSRLSAPAPQNPTSTPPDTALRDARTPTANAAGWPASSRDADGALVAPSRFRVVSNVRTVESDPELPKSGPKDDPPIPAAFALATPNAARKGMTSRNIAKARPRDDDDLGPAGDSADLPVTPVALVSKKRAEKDNVEEAADDPPQLPPATPIPFDVADSKRTSSSKSKPSPVEAVATRAEPIPKAAPLPATPRKFKLANVSLCREIKGFGRTVPIAGPLRPGREVIVYTEVSGRSVKPTPKGVETRLRGKLRLTPTSGSPTIEWTKPEIVNVEPAENNEFYCFMMLHLPESLCEGDYRLEVVVDDVHGGASAREATSLHVAPTAAATK